MRIADRHDFLYCQSGRIACRQGDWDEVSPEPCHGFSDPFHKGGYDFSIFMTAFMMLISAFMIIYTIVIYATSQPVAGWTITILFLSIAFFGLFGVLTIIIKYLQLLIDLVFLKQHYSFRKH